MQRTSCFAAEAKLARATLLEKPSPVNAAKAVKTAAELDGMREAHLRDAVALAQTLHWIETEVATYLLILSWEGCKCLLSRANVCVCVCVCVCLQHSSILGRELWLFRVAGWIPDGAGASGAGGPERAHDHRGGGG